jgi:2-keto-3-deoxy-L-rhamnonate aldolase RhmA
MKNPLKEKLRRGEAVIGTFVELGHPDVTEWLAHLGFDWLLLDAEHAPTDLVSLERMMQSMKGTACAPLVRPQWNDPAIIKRILDIGAYGVLVPWVNNKKEAETAVQACKYPPQGIRGYGPRRAGMLDKEYYQTANDEILVTVQIETEEALANLDDILSVPGIDAVYIGPWDLSSNLGFGIPPTWDEPRYAAALERVLTAARKHKKPAGMFATLDTIDWVVKKGYTFNTVDSDDGFLVRAARQALEKARNAAKK